jgi:hypothetical protein
MRRHEGVQTLPTTALVNEAFLKLARAGEITSHNRIHFLALSAQVAGWRFARAWFRTEMAGAKHHG